MKGVKSFIEVKVDEVAAQVDESQETIEQLLLRVSALEERLDRYAARVLGFTT